MKPDAARRPLGLLAGRPLAGAAVALIAGIAVHARLPVAVPLWLGAALVMLIGVALTRRYAGICTGLILLGVACFGAAMAQLHADYYPADHIAHFTTETRRLAQLEITLLDPPRIYAPTYGQAYPIPPRQTTLAEVNAIRTWQGWKQSQGRVLVQISEPNAALRVGQRVRAFGMLDRPAPSMNPGQFDWATYYRRQRVLGSLHIPHAGNLMILEEGSPTWLQRWRAWTRDKLADGFTDQQSLDHALLRALVLGDSDPELRDVQEQFRKTGTSHHLAISGMHIAVMGGVVFLMTRLLRLSPRTSWWVALGFVIAYGLAALPSAPVVRSVLLWIALGVALIGRRGIDLLQLLSLVVIGMLIYQPLDLFNPGFQLSFGIVLGLIVLTAPMARALGQRRKEDDPTRPPAPTRWLLRTAAYIDSQILLILSAGAVAWLVSMPIIASHFAQLNPWAILASILIAPVVFLSLIAGVLKILLTALWPGLAWLWADAARQPVTWMRSGVDWLSQLPLGDVPMPAPAWWMIGLFYFTLLLAGLPWPRPGMRLLTRIGHALAIGVLLFLPMRSTLTQDNPSGALRITLLAIGAGQCAVVEPPSGRTTIIDAGSLSLADPVRRAIAPFLRERGITRLDTIAVSHGNSDHFSAVAELVEAYGAREVLTAPRFEQSMIANPMGHDMLASLKRNQRPPTKVMPGHAIPLGSDTTIEFLWPPDAPQLQSNDQSLVLMLTHAGTRMLFTGDIQDAAMTGLLEHPESIRADILVAPHHGSREAMTPAFLRAVSPKAIVVSNDRTLTDKQHRFDELAGATPLYRTHIYGAITIFIDAHGVYRINPHIPSR